MPRLTATMVLALLAAVNGSGQNKIYANADRMQTRIEALGRFGANEEGGVSRVSFSEADVAGRGYIQQLMRSAGLNVRIDAAGNAIGRRAGRENDLPPILFGSHIDSVAGGGNYDGDVGVIGAIEAIELLNEHGIETRHPLEVVSFTDEEGGLVGSRAMIGTSADETLKSVSHSGLALQDGIRKVGGDPGRLDLAARKSGDVAAYIELHIEQGAILDEEDIDIGVVEGIVGIRWWDITVEGVANHAGTTPMNRRRDALLSAAELTIATNRIANELDGRQVATVGRIEAFPGASNVVPGKVTMSLEIRDLDAEKMQQVFDLVKSEAARIAEEKSTPIRFTERVTLTPTPTDPLMRDIIAAAASELGFSSLRMPSGAGHDAQHIAQIAPTGMIFVPSVGGISHSPKEFTSARDMVNGASVLLRTILAVDGGAL